MLVNKVGAAGGMAQGMAHGRPTGNNGGKRLRDKRGGMKKALPKEVSINLI